MRYIVALKNSDHVAHFISNKVFAHLIVNIWSSIQQSNTRPETFLIIILIIKPKIWCLRLEMLECCLQHLTVYTRVQWLQFESSNIKFSSRAGIAMWILRSLALARIRESKHIKWGLRKLPLVFVCFLSCSLANICASYCLWEFKNNLQFWLESSKIKISQLQFEYALHLNNETRGHCAVIAQNYVWGQYLPNTFSNLINIEQPNTTGVLNKRVGRIFFEIC